jgi:putative flippase GtrA
MGISKTQAEFLKFLIAGVISTLVHYAAFWTLLNIAGVTPVGLANAIASILGILSAFLLNKIFVFQVKRNATPRMILSFLLVYSSVPILHFIVTFILSDTLGLHYNIGFIGALCVQIPTTFLGNKYMTFKEIKDGNTQQI